MLFDENLKGRTKIAKLKQLPIITNEKML